MCIVRSLRVLTVLGLLVTTIVDYYIIVADDAIRIAGVHRRYGQHHTTIDLYTIGHVHVLQNLKLAQNAESEICLELSLCVLVMGPGWRVARSY